MQRQSLGSPGRSSSSVVVLATSSNKDDIVSSKNIDESSSKRRESSSSLSSPLTSFSDNNDVDDEIKPEKPLRCHYSQPEKFIHFIPLLIVVCFFILYLSSHDPSPTDLAQFSGFKHPEKIIDSTDIDEIGRVNNENKSMKRNAVFSIRSLRNLQEENQGDNTTQKSRSHRKLGDF